MCPHGASAFSPGATTLAQLRLAAPVAALPGQRFILRGFRAIEGRGKTVLLVDDGVATGSTLRAAIQSLRQRGVRGRRVS